jgi:hypothetical protein
VLAEPPNSSNQEFVLPAAGYVKVVKTSSYFSRFQVQKGACAWVESSCHKPDLLRAQLSAFSIAK